MKRSTRKPINISSRRWLSYAAAGAATAAVGMTSAEAEIHYSGGVDLAFKVSGNSPETQTAPLSGGAYLLFQQVNSFTTYLTNFFAIENAAVAGVRASLAFASRLVATQVISKGQFEGSDNPGEFFLLRDYSSGQFLGSGVGFIGFRFDVGKGFQYGWARIRTFPKGSYEVIDYAWGDPGDKIKAGQKSLNEADAVTGPREGSLGVLALGGAGLLTWRKRRRAG